MSSAARQKATYAELLAVPAPLVAEIIRGTLVTMPRPAVRHARASTQLGGELHGFGSGGGPGGWVNLDEPELHLDDEVLVPDLRPGGVSGSPCSLTRPSSIAWAMSGCWTQP